MNFFNKGSTNSNSSFSHRFEIIKKNKKNIRQNKSKGVADCKTIPNVVGFTSCSSFSKFAKNINKNEEFNNPRNLNNKTNKISIEVDNYDYFEDYDDDKYFFSNNRFRSRANSSRIISDVRC